MADLQSTRLHSSRMRTARVLTVSPSMLWPGGGVPSPGGGGVCSGDIPGQGGVPGPGVSAPRGCLLPGEGGPGREGVFLLGGVSGTPPPCEQNHRHL